MVTVASRMALIEGVGDEVVVFLTIVFILGCIMLAWFSTSVADQPLIRTAVLVIERRRTASRVNESVPEADRGTTAETTSAGKMPTPFQPSTSTGGSQTPDENNKDIVPGTSHTPAVDANSEEFVHRTDAGDSSSAEDVKNEQCVIEQSGELRKRTAAKDKALPADSLSESVARNETPQDSATTIQNQQAPLAEEVTNIVCSIDGMIRIRLKFLNDTQRMVEGKLEEPLGEFKRRYFGEELENDKIVRLIFNGQLLRSDQETLQFYGLFDNCVVHCQISNNITPLPTVQSENYNELDLSRFMLPLFGVLLGATWYCRIQYRQFFNATSTFALLGITGLFFVSLAAVFIPRREHPQPTWTVEETSRR